MPIPVPDSTPLFTADDLTIALGETVSDAEAFSAERVVWGWLRPVLGLTDRPDPVSPEVFSWALELGCIFHENPAGLAEYLLGAERTKFSSERRAEILIEASEGGVSGSTGRPRGTFPAAPTYPDPAVFW